MLRLQAGQAGSSLSQVNGLRICRYSLAVGVALAAVVLTIPGPAVAGGKPAVVIKMSDKPSKFLPDKVSVKVGQTVEWVNNAKTLHSVDADPSMVQKSSDVVLPPGAKPFDSGFMPPGATFDYTFTLPGTYRYTCVPHEKDGMNGEVVVTK
jgi:plastocyanin